MLIVSLAAVLEPTSNSMKPKQPQRASKTDARPQKLVVVASEYSLVHQVLRQRSVSDRRWRRRRGTRRSLGVAVPSKHIAFLGRETKGSKHDLGGPAVMHDDPNGSAAARSQVRLAVEEEKDDFSGARSELHQRVPAHLQSVGLQPFYQLELLRHGPGHRKIRDHRQRRDG
ncbi:unnamed protein product [Musa acuminata subsp. burmannicoides]